MAHSKYYKSDSAAVLSRSSQDVALETCRGESNRRDHQVHIVDRNLVTKLMGKDFQCLLLASELTMKDLVYQIWPVTPSSERSLSR